MCNLLRMNADCMSSVVLQYTVMFNVKTVSRLGKLKPQNTKVSYNLFLIKTQVYLHGLVEA